MSFFNFQNFCRRERGRGDHCSDCRHTSANTGATHGLFVEVVFLHPETSCCIPLSEDIVGNFHYQFQASLKFFPRCLI